jgi:hypothetical protein
VWLVLVVRKDGKSKAIGLRSGTRAEARLQGFTGGQSGTWTGVSSGGERFALLYCIVIAPSPGCGGEDVARRSRKLALAREIDLAAMAAWSRSRASVSVSMVAKRCRMRPMHDCAGGYAIRHAGVQGGSEQPPWEHSDVRAWPPSARIECAYAYERERRRLPRGH